MAMDDSYEINVACADCKWTGTQPGGMSYESDAIGVMRHDADALSAGRDPEDCGPLVAS